MPAFPCAEMQASVEKLNGQMQQVQEALDHEANKLKEFEADRKVLQDRCYFDGL